MVKIKRSFEWKEYHLNSYYIFSKGGIYEKYKKSDGYDYDCSRVV